MGTSAKAVATFGMLILDAPTHANTLLTWAVQSIPNFSTFPPMVQAALLFFLVQLPIAAAGARLIWWVKNHPGQAIESEQQQEARGV